MPAVSKAQQKFFGIVRAIQKGEMAPTTPETAKVAADMKKSDVKKFASTKHKGLPDKKEVKEESGIQSLISLDKEIFDIDIHKIPPSRNSIAHTHYDVRFLLQADPISSKITVSEESFDVAWIPTQKVLTLNSEPSIERMLQKTLILKKQQNI